MFFDVCGEGVRAVPVKHREEDSMATVAGDQAVQYALLIMLWAKTWHWVLFGKPRPNLRTVCGSYTILGQLTGSSSAALTFHCPLHHELNQDAFFMRQKRHLLYLSCTSGYHLSTNPGPGLKPSPSALCSNSNQLPSCQHAEAVQTELSSSSIPLHEAPL